MGFLLHDAIIITKARCNLKNHRHLFSLGKPRSFVLAKDLRFIFNDKNLKKLNINLEVLDKKYYYKLFNYDDNKIINFNFFVKLLSFKNNFSIDIDPKTKPDYCLDITSASASNFLFNKADLIYDTGSLGYTNYIISAINSLRRILKKDGIIVHSLPSNGHINTGNVQFNKIYLQKFYSQIKFRILFIGYGFIQNFFTKIFFSRGESRIIDIDTNPLINKIKNNKCSIYYVVKNNLLNTNKDNLFFKKCFTINVFFRKYLKGFLFVKF